MGGEVGERGTRGRDVEYGAIWLATPLGSARARPGGFACLRAQRRARRRIRAGPAVKVRGGLLVLLEDAPQRARADLALVHVELLVCAGVEVQSHVHHECDRVGKECELLANDEGGTCRGLDSRCPGESGRGRRALAEVMGAHHKDDHVREEDVAERGDESLRGRQYKG